VICGVSEKEAPQDCTPRPLDNKDALRIAILTTLYDSAQESPNWLQDADYLARSVAAHVYYIIKDKRYHINMTGPKQLVCTASSFPMEEIAVLFDPAAPNTTITIEHNPTFEQMVAEKLDAELVRLGLSARRNTRDMALLIKGRWRQYVTQLREG